MLRDLSHLDLPARAADSFTLAHAHDGDAGPGNADAYAEPAGADASGYGARRPDRLAHARAHDGYRARGDVHVRAAHASARGHAPRRGADRRQSPSAAPRR